MEIRPATIAQIIESDGEFVTIDDDVQNVANNLNAIDHHFRLRHSKAGGYFVVYWLPDGDEEGNGYLVTTAQELDQRIVKRVEEIYWKVRNDPTYSYADELDKQDAKAKKEKDDAWAEKIGPIAERLAFEMRRELGYTDSRTYIPKEIPDAAA